MTGYRFYEPEKSGISTIPYEREEVKGLLKNRADKFSTKATNEGIKLVWDGKGSHTKKLPSEWHSHVKNTDGARFVASTWSGDRREKR